MTHPTLATGSRADGSPPGAVALRRLGLACILVNACARVVTSYDPLPGWSLDPFTTVAPDNGVGPALSVLLSALSFAGLALVLAGAWRARERAPGVALALAALGLVPVAYHGWLGHGASVENAAHGVAWAGAIAGAIGAAVACRHPADRALAVACCVGVAGPMAIRAAVQVYMEHPVLVEDFRANRGAFLASHGWAPDSAMARSFERRLSQPDASAWFAMSNVYASFMAGCAAVFCAGCVGAARLGLWSTGERKDLYRAVGLALGLACAVGGLFLALPAGGEIPKGAAGALVLGLTLVGLGLWRARRLAAGPGGQGWAGRAVARAGPWLGPGLVGLALAGVLCRGLIGERLGELSILFRAYYAEAALRIVGAHPLWGVGPDGFQGAYLLAKNPLSPEEVSSPHSVMLDYASTLGVLGLAWCALVVAMASRAGAGLLRGVADPPATNPGTPARRTLACTVLVCIAVSFAIETLPLARAAPDAFDLLLVDGSIKLLLAALLWLALAAPLLSLAGAAGGGTLVIGACAAALAMLTHAQIELTATDIASCSWFFVVLGAASAGPAPRGAGPAARAGVVVSTAGAAVLAAALVVSAIPLRAWQAELRATARLAREPTRFIQRANALAAGSPDDTPAALFADLSDATGAPVPPTTDGFNRAMDRFRLTRMREAAGRLDDLARRGLTPSREVADIAIQTRLSLVGLEAQLGLDPAEPARAALDLASWATARWPGDSRLWRALSQATRAASELAPRLVPAGEPGPDLPALLRAASLDPYSPQLAMQIALRLESLGRAAEAAEWAGRALASHERRRLDPLAGLSENQVQSLRELAGDP